MANMDVYIHNMHHASREIDICTPTCCAELPRYAALRGAVEAQIAAFQLVLQSHEAGIDGVWVIDSNTIWFVYG